VWDSLAPWLASGGGAGIAGAIAWLVYRLHADAVAAERRRADDWRAAAVAAEARADVREGQIGILLGRAREPEPVRAKDPV
jgi:hypothetical protein